ncbi:MAG TPA: hypothetical protein VFE70_01180 [Candidatus Elarobacter sp.]|nr:hypothetical protein [Candidatus Elarobacter sp.]
MQNVTGDRMLDEILAAGMPPTQPGTGDGDQPPPDTNDDEGEDDAPA